MRARQREVLFAACRRGGPGAPLRLPERDWAAVVDAATALGVAGHLHTALAADPARGGMAAADWARLQGVYYAIGARNAVLLTDLREVLSALQGRGIDVIVLKGAALAETVYRNLAVRPMQDLDVLVRERDTAGAARVLEELGFAPDDWYRPAEWYRTSLHHLVPYKRGQVTVEVHHHLLPPAVPNPVPLGEIWERGHAASVAGVPVRVLAPEHLLMHLTLHLVLSDRFAAGLLRLRDIAEAVDHHAAALDWNDVARASRGLERAMYAGLRAARDAAGAGVPDSVLAELRGAGGVGPLERGWIHASARRLAVRAGERAIIPTWFSMAWMEELLARRAWPARMVSVLRRVVDSWAAQGRKRGYGRWSVLYGVLVHPWQGLARRVNREPGA